ncbi:hypothetical protein SAMN05428952_10501, partial [Nitrosomonas sp. Nm132]
LLRGGIVASEVVASGIPRKNICIEFISKIVSSQNPVCLTAYFCISSPGTCNRLIYICSLEFFKNEGCSEIRLSEAKALFRVWHVCMFTTGTGFAWMMLGGQLFTTSSGPIKITRSPFSGWLRTQRAEPKHLGVVRVALA